MKDYLREKQTEGLEEETEEDFILKYLQKGIRETDRRKNGRYQRVFEEEAETSL